MNKKSRLKLLMKSLFMQFGSVKTDEGVQLLWDEETELIVGYNVYIEQENENGDLEYVPAPDGEYKSGNTTFVIADGKCTEIRNEEPAQEEMNQEPAQEEQMAEETPAEEPAQEPANDEPEFDPRKAIEDMRAEYDQKINDLTTEVSDLRAQVEALLALPAEENAFEKQAKEENNAKPLFKTRNQN